MTFHIPVRIQIAHEYNFNSKFDCYQLKLLQSIVKALILSQGMFFLSLSILQKMGLTMHNKILRAESKRNNVHNVNGFTLFSRYNCLSVCRFFLSLSHPFTSSTDPFSCTLSNKRNRNMFSTALEFVHHGVIQFAYISLFKSTKDQMQFKIEKCIVCGTRWRRTETETPSV